jgi:hypothetical protein
MEMDVLNHVREGLRERPDSHFATSPRFTLERLNNEPAVPR